MHKSQITVIPAQAGIPSNINGMQAGYGTLNLPNCIPACAGMTKWLFSAAVK
jgi:hypothetical protein